ncbi:DUF3151 family protein [Candidatus Poriferisodalis sp.]|uniref:DUF3151 family protein n=1 Tax=Candidatus Poriferisodalis sp. TaxID=3101277 RepID=UPI003B01F776
MTATPIDLRPGGLPETVLGPAPEAAAAALRAALAQPLPERADALGVVAARWPRMLDAWAELGRCAAASGRHVEAYAYCRVGYHRGLDALRAAGWRGSGYVRWAEAANHGFLWSLLGLGRSAAAIGEHDEAERCAGFLTQLDPGGRPPAGEWPAA